MPTLILNSYSAERNGAFLSIAITAEGPLPKRTVEIKRTADAVTALDAYKAELAALGKPAVASMRLARGERAPAGFRKLSKEFHEVNL